MNHKLVTKATRGPRCTTSLFISSYFSAWSATNQLATSLIRSRRWNYNAQFVGYWPRGNGACGKPDTYQSADGILGRIRDPTNLRPPLPPSLSLSVRPFYRYSPSVSVPFSFHTVHPSRTHPSVPGIDYDTVVACISSIGCRRLGISMLISCDV